jgi:CO/xanthine dehydrogenase FAD-binding subunit
MQHFQFYSASTIEDALSFLSEAKGTCKVIAGGTDLIPILRKDELIPDYVLNILEIKESATITETEDGVRIGATTTFTQIVQSEIINRTLPILAQAAAWVGGPQIRNRGTIGGNIVTASPAADVLPAVMAVDGLLELSSKRSGKRVIPLADAIKAPYKPDLRPDELLTAILVRKPSPGMRFGFVKLGRRKAMARARMNLSIVLGMSDDGSVKELSIVPGALLPVARRIREAEDILVGRKPTASIVENAATALSECILSVTGVRWSTEFKLPVVKNLFKGLFKHLAANHHSEAFPWQKI